VSAPEREKSPAVSTPSHATPSAPPGDLAARRRTLTGIAFVAASALGYGSMPVFARLASLDGVEPRSLLLLRFSTAAAVSWALFAVRRGRLPSGRGLLTLVGMGAIGYAGQSFCYFTALTHASAGLVALLLYLFPALVALLSWLVLRHPLTRIQLGALAMALLGSLLTIGRAADGSALGVAFGLGAALIYSVYILVGARLPADVSPVASTAVVTSAAAATYLVQAAVGGVQLPASAAGWLGVGGVVLFGTVMAIALFLAGLERLGAVRASVYSTLEPVFTLGLSAALLGEALTPLRLLGGALILGAVLLLARVGVAA